MNIHVPETAARVARLLAPAGPVVVATLRALLYVGAYVALDWISYVQPVLKLGITPWNPQAGLTLAFLISRGPVWMAATICAALLSEAVVRGTPAPAPLLLAGSVWIGVCYAMLATLLRRIEVASRLDSLQTAARIATGAGIGAAIVALGFVGLYVASGALAPKSFGTSVVRYWVGDFNGILLMTPLLLAATRWRSAWTAIRSRWAEVVTQAVTLAALVWLIFVFAGLEEVRFLYALFVPVIWLALRWGAGGSLLGILMIQIGLIISVRDAGTVVPLVDLQFLMLTLGLTGLLLGAAVSARAAALAEVEAGAAEVRALLATAPDAVLTADADGRLRSANHAATALFGLPDAAGGGVHSLGELLPGVALHSGDGRATVRARRSDGTGFPADVAWVRLEAAARTGWLAIVRDATGRRRAEAQLRERDTALARAMRFAVAGELASALAHELKQPITALASYLRAAQIMAAPGAGDERLAVTLDKAVSEAERAGAVLQRLRNFYLGGPGRSTRFSLAEMCGSIAHSLDERLAANEVTLVIDIDAGLPAVETSATHLEIVLQNLLANAIDAVCTQGAARRRIELRARAADGAIVIEVEDSGPGVAPEGLPRLFEPLNTTKPDGMGLGLAISRSLLSAQGGELSYRRGGRLGGAAFVVSIPHATRAAAAH
ncbi:MAG: MASE1 domain-containing protein [Steroidobacteraceae bacterium]